MVLTVSFALSLVSRAFLPPSPARREKPVRAFIAIPPTSHQRRDVRTTRLRRPRDARSRPIARAASIASRVNVRDDRDTPLWVARDGRGYTGVSGEARSEKISARDWTTTRNSERTSGRYITHEVYLANGRSMGERTSRQAVVIVGQDR